MPPNVVVAGGGVGGLVAASELARRLKSRAVVSLIERKPRFQFPPSFPWVVMGTRAPQQVERELSRLKARGVRVVQEEITGFDLPGSRVRTSQSEVPFDSLVVALGAEYAPEAIPGFADRAQHMYDLDSAVRLRQKVDGFEGGTIAVGIARLPFKCPVAPYEMAFLLDDAFRRRKLREKVRIEFFTPEGFPLPAAGPDNGSKVAAMLAERGIAYHPKYRLKEVMERSLEFEDGGSLPFDLLICVPPHRAPRPVSGAGLTDQSGWVPVDPGTMMTQHPGVYAIGDVAAVPTPHGYVPFLPKAGVFASGQAKVVAHNIAASILGRATPQVWDGYGGCFLEVARGRSAFLSGNFLGSPRPELRLRPPSAIYHTQKVLFERYWLSHWT